MSHWMDAARRYSSLVCFFLLLLFLSLLIPIIHYYFFIHLGAFHACGWMRRAWSANIHEKKIISCGILFDNADAFLMMAQANSIRFLRPSAVRWACVIWNSRYDWYFAIDEKPTHYTNGFWKVKNKNKTISFFSPSSSSFFFLFVLYFAFSSFRLERAEGMKKET